VVAVTTLPSGRTDRGTRCHTIRGAFKSYIDIFRNGKNPHYTENIYSCGLNVFLDLNVHFPLSIELTAKVSPKI
jgi:hypothetical protein